MNKQEMLDEWISSVKSKIGTLRQQKVGIQIVVRDTKDSHGKMTLKSALDTIDNALSIREEELNHYLQIKSIL